MKLKSLFLGSAAALALGTSAQAADPIAVALDVCDLLGISGLTISSETNCLKFEGDVSYEWKWGNYDVDGDIAGTQNTFSDVEWSLKATATADSDFGPAMAVIKISEGNDNPAVTTAPTTTDVVLSEAYVGIGDSSSTVLYAGKKGSIEKIDDDETFTAIFSLDTNDGDDEGLGLQGVTTGGYVLQASASLGDGVNAAVGLENLGVSDSASLVGAIGVKQDWGTAHATFVYDDLIGAATDWAFHAGATFNFDDVSVRGAFATEDGGNWDAVLTGKATFDMFTLAAGAEFDESSAWEAAVSGVAKVDDNVTLTAAGRWDNASNWDIALKGAFKVSDTLTASAKVNFDEASVTALETDLDWAPGGGTTVNVGFNASSNGNTSVSTKFAKTFE